MGTWKYIKVFVSSTFQDMDIERDALKNIVEPRLNEELRLHSCNIEFIDLRHSVKTTSNMSLKERELQIFNVCLDEIDNCKPYFLGMMGSRYGWVPNKDGVECPEINIPDNFPIKEKDLSVTMYEFLHGIFASDDPGQKALILLRTDESYDGLSINDRKIFIESYENPDRSVFLNDIKKYINLNRDKYNVVEYVLPIASYTDSDLLSWAEIICKHILNLIKEEIQTVEIDKYEAFSIAQENYIQDHVNSFYGREKELKDCKTKIDHRHDCIITAKVRGLGLTSFFCKTYDDLRQNEKNVCLLYCQDADPSFAPQDAITNWLLQMDKLNGSSRRQQILESINSEEILPIIWEELTTSLNEKGFKIYRFCESFSSNHQIDFTTYHADYTITTCYYHEDIFFIRPLMFIIEPIDQTTTSLIIGKLRPEVKEILITHPSSSNAKWLKFAVTILNKMNRQDFTLIRSREEKDNEERIIHHQVDLVNKLPNDIDDMMLLWIDRLKIVFGANTIDKYLFLMSLCDEGWKEDDLCNILGYDSLQITTIRQMLGDMIIKQTHEHLWSFTNEEVKELFTEHFKLEDYRNLIDLAYSYISKLPEDNIIYERLIFKLAMLNREIQFCSTFIEQNPKGSGQITEYAVNSILWFAYYYKLNYLSFISNIVTQEFTQSHQFFHNLIQWVKVLWHKDTLDEHLISIERIISTLRTLWQNKRIDLKTYSEICDALSCKTDYYREQRDIKKMIECIDYGILLGKDYCQEQQEFLSFYHYSIIRKLEQIIDKDAAYKWLTPIFIIPEQKGLFNYHPETDTTTYAILLWETAELMIKRCHTEQATFFWKKSFHILLDLLSKQEAKIVQINLTPADTRRNLLKNLFYSLRLNFHSGFPTWVQLAPLCDQIFDICQGSRQLMDKDYAYVFYYKAKAASILLQNTEKLKKMEQLHRLCHEILEKYDGSFLNFYTNQRNNEKVDHMFIVYLYAFSIMLYIQSSLPNGKFIYNEALQGILTYKIADKEIKRPKSDTVDQHFMSILPLVGAKKFDENGLPPIEIWDSMLFLYISMMNAELLKRKPDSQYLVSVFQSCRDLIDVIIVNNLSIPTDEHIKTLSKLDQRISRIIKSTVGFDNIDFNARFNDFSDSLGVPGNFYSDPNGFWANRDPELDD